LAPTRFERLEDKLFGVARPLNHTIPSKPPVVFPVRLITPPATDISHDPTGGRLAENAGIAFRGVGRSAAFAISDSRARRLLAAPNRTGRPNCDVVRPWAGAADLLRAPQHRWTVDFPPHLEEREAALYALPFAHVRRRAGPARVRRHRWWLQGSPQVDLRVALARRERYLATPAAGRRRVFAWFPPEALPGRDLVVFARDDDWFFGVLHSRFHQIWALCLGTELREKESGFRYTPTTCFETFPFPWPPATPLGKLTREQEDQRTAIARTARALEAARAEWLGDRTDKKRTLTALYNARPGWLAAAHAALDEAVAAAYGWPDDLPEDEIVSRLLLLNRTRATIA
jgi:hypothetical protein